MQKWHFPTPVFAALFRSSQDHLKEELSHPQGTGQSRSPALGEAVVIVAGGLLPARVPWGWHLKFEVGREKALDKDPT